MFFVIYNTCLVVAQCGDDNNLTSNILTSDVVGDYKQEFASQKYVSYRYDIFRQVYPDGPAEYISANDALISQIDNIISNSSFN
jgi:hypothetical protein